MRRAGQILLGLALGWLLSRLRLAPGHAWLDGPVADGADALFTRAAAIAFAGFAIGPAARGVGALFLAAVAAGLALHGLLLPRPLGAPLWDILLVGAVLGFAGWMGKRGEEPDPPPRAAVGERIGLFLAGAGAALVLELIARHVRLLGDAEIQDDAAFAVSFAVLVAVGAACFGWITRPRSVERWALPFLLAAVAAAGFASLSIVKGLAQPNTFAAFLDRYGLDRTWHGTLQADALIAGSVFVLPAFLLGLALCSARGAGSLSSTLLGAGAGLAAIPALLARDPAVSTAQEELFSAQYLPFGLMAALLGAGLALLSVPGRTARARWIAFAAVLPLGLPILLVTPRPVLILSPWEKRLILPFVAFETPEGLATVEPGAGGLKLATLDRRLLSPGLTGVGADREQLRTAFLCLNPEVRERGAVRVLLVGQLTALRAAWLGDLGAASIDRTGAWHLSMPRMEAELFQDLPRPAGEVLDPAEAARRVASGAYDLVVCPSVSGDAPLWRSAGSVPAATVLVRWVALDVPIHRGLPASTFADGATGPTHVLAGGGLDQTFLGVVTHGRSPASDAPGRAEFARFSGRPAQPGPLQRLLLRKIFRTDATRLALARELARQDPRPLTRALEDFAAAQRPSSPYETEAERIELETSTLDFLWDAAQAAPPSAFVQQMWEWAARTLVGKRDVGALFHYVESLAERWAPWPALEVALARADLEALDAPRARERLDALVRRGDTSFDVWSLLGAAREAVGDAPGAIEAWRRALERRRDDRWVRRRLAMALVRAGDPEGVSIVRELLAVEPHDEELELFLGPGPWPPPADGYTPDAAHPR